VCCGSSHWGKHLGREKKKLEGGVLKHLYTAVKTKRAESDSTGKNENSCCLVGTDIAGKATNAAARTSLVFQKSILHEMRREKCRFSERYEEKPQGPSS